MVTPAAVGLVPAGASGLALSYDTKRVAMVVDGSVVTSTALSDTPALEAPPATPDAPGGPVIPTAMLVKGSNLVAPSFDPHGWLWTTETLSDGTITVAGPDGKLVQLAAPQLAGRAIQALAVSRDGARLAVLSRASGVQVLEAMAVVRGDAGIPLSLGATLALGPAVPASVDVAWLDNVSVAALSADSSRISMVEVGGWTTEAKAPTGATSITARNGAPTLLAVGAGGALVARSGNDWAPKASNVSEVAFAG
jgi:Lipoprotein LpqB beta-propeller domain